MNLFTNLDTRIAAISDFLPGDVTVQTLGTAVSSLDDEQVLVLASCTAQARQLLEQIALATSAAISARSTRAAGHSGLAQSRGHRNPASLIQQVTGVSRGAAMQQIRVAESLMQADEILETTVETIVETMLDSAGVPVEVPVDIPVTNLVRRTPWHEPLTAAFRDGLLSSAQHDAIKRGLGEPPAGDISGLGAPVPFPEAIAAWTLAAEELFTYAAEVPVEELGKQARAVRDVLDPEGADARFTARYEQRSFRLWTDSDGLTHGRFTFDDVSAEWVRTIIDTALRPRRGGPRFVTAEEQAAAKQLRDDPRTNEQLTHDLLIDVLKAGSVADAATVFGVRQAGIKLVQVVDRDAYLADQVAKRNSSTGRGTGAAGAAAITGITGAGAVSGAGAGAASGAGAGASAVSGASTSAGAGEGNRSGVDGLRRPVMVTRLQESGTILPHGVGDTHRCNTGTQPVIADQHGNPLDVGRERRLYTAKQRVALAIRDGGCRWTGCDRPASYCEAHHIDHWEADGGRTDIDKGLLVCAFHHMQLHNNGWKITRDGLGPFLLHAPPPKVTLEKPDPGLEGTAAPTSDTRREAEPPKQIEPPGQVEPSEQVESPGQTAPIELRPPLPLNYAWQLATPPAKQFHAAA